MQQNEQEGVSAPYRPSNSRPGPIPSRPIPTIALRTDFADHEAIRSAGVAAAWLWLCAVAEVRKRGGQPFLSLHDLRRLVDFEELGVKARTAIEAGVAAGLLARTKDGYLIIDDILRG